MLKTSKYIYKNVCPSIKMENLSLKEFRLIAKNRNVRGYKSMPTDKLLGIIINNNNNKNNKVDRKSIFKSKKEENKKFL